MVGLPLSPTALRALGAGDVGAGKEDPQNGLIGVQRRGMDLGL